MSVRSLHELHEEGGAPAEFVEKFAAAWHDGDWNTAEDHWQLLVNRLLRSRDMEGLKRRDALRTAEREVQNLGLSLLRSGAPTRCPECAVAPPQRPPDPPRPMMEPR
ncbi:DUF6313 family protein [Streptomyces africanus]|uniref:DUF6313 family protein n=1 Tax=Streptomyces africanus TaxID=231024 RepID=UPI000A3D0EE7|nr:DUF6313 family protein [Streptomyces africanus]